MDQIHSIFLQIDSVLLIGQLLVLGFILKNKFTYSNRWLLYFFSFGSIVIAYFLGFLNGIIIDELGMGGKPLFFYFEISIIGLGIVLFFVTLNLSQKMKNEKRT